MVVVVVDTKRSTLGCLVMKCVKKFRGLLKKNAIWLDYLEVLGTESLLVEIQCLHRSASWDDHHGDG